MIPQLISAAALTVALSLALTPIVRQLLGVRGVVDRPTARSSHQGVAVRGVGAAVVLAFAGGAAIAIASELPDSAFIVLVLAVGISMGALGFLDDVSGLSVRLRLLVQAIIGVLGSLLLCELAGLALVWAPLVALFLVALVNASNFMDGLDGISALHGMVAGGAFMSIGLIRDEVWLTALGLTLGLSFAGFLPWNLGKRGTFLGDTGSYFLGAIVATTVVLAVMDGAGWLAALGCTAVYLADTGVTLVKRLLRRQDWLAAHRTHVYQRLTDLGFSHLGSSALVATFSAATAALGLATLPEVGLADAAALWGMILIVVTYLALPTLLRGEAHESVGPALEPSRLPTPMPHPPDLRWIVVGASGFVGSAISRELAMQGRCVSTIQAPRLVIGADLDSDRIVEDVAGWSEEIEGIAQRFEGHDVVVNAAGLAMPDSDDNPELYGANSALPVLLYLASRRAGVRRFVHLSSAAVQGRCRLLDETARVAPFSPYSRSKARGERALLAAAGSQGTGADRPALTILRATSVQGEGRPTTDSLRRIARSRLASVAAPGSDPSVVSSVTGLARFVRIVGEWPEAAPKIVLQPSEGLSTEQVLALARGSAPMRLPRTLCRAVVALGFVASRVLPPLSGIVRRVEMMWFGQGQVSGWALENRIDVGRDAISVLAGKR